MSQLRVTACHSSVITSGLVREADSRTALVVFLFELFDFLLCLNEVTLHIRGLVQGPRLESLVLLVSLFNGRVVSDLASMSQQLPACHG